MVMKMINKRVFASIILGAALTAGCSGEADTARFTSGPVASGDIPLGVPDAPVEIVEYASITCSVCRTFHYSILPALKANYIATGQAKYIFRDFPTPPKAVAAAGGAVARCAGEDKYHDVIDDLFKNQYEILEATRAGGALQQLIEIGGRAGLSENDVQACVDDEAVLSHITVNEDLGRAKGVTGTPTVFINGELVPGQDMSVEGISRRIDAALAAQSQ